MKGCTSGGNDQLETSPEAIEQECDLQSANADRLKANYSVDGHQHWNVGSPPY